ncbi:MAG: hypothetical protein H6544_03895 [Prevotellaceae bacterium]|nr:hypothetical protein [Prevotellaceae bacterium]
MARYLTNSDKVLQAVLSDERLMAHAQYNPMDYETIAEALDSDNAVVCAVAKIIDGKGNNATDKEIYNEVTNYLKSNLI